MSLPELGLGLRALGFGAYDLGFRVLGLRVWGLGFRVYGFGGSGLVVSL